MRWPRRRRECDVSAAVTTIRNLWRRRKPCSAIPTTISIRNTRNGWPTRRKRRNSKGDPAYFDSILDKLNVEICLANRAMMAPYLDPEALPLGVFRRLLFLSL